jgi:hypothetical protein
MFSYITLQVHKVVDESYTITLQYQVIDGKYLSWFYIDTTRKLDITDGKF